MSQEQDLASGNLEPSFSVSLFLPPFLMYPMRLCSILEEVLTPVPTRVVAWRIRGGTVCRKKASGLALKCGVEPAGSRGEPQSEASPLAAGLSRGLGFKRN